jgi:rRNA-processing protein FCF1
MSSKTIRIKKTLMIILDSNALFVPLQFKIDIPQELRKVLDMRFQLILLSSVRRELESLAHKGSPKMQKSASYALKMAEKYELVEFDDGKSGSSSDDAIFHVARKWKCSVFTNDRELRKRLRNINVPVIYVRQKSRLEIDGRL